MTRLNTKAATTRRCRLGAVLYFSWKVPNENYKNGDVILGDLTNEEWVEASNSMIGAQAFFDNNESQLHPPIWTIVQSYYAVNDERGLCPTGYWYVPSIGEFMTLELELGMNEDEVTLGGWRGSNQGDQMKSSSEDVPSWDGTNSSGFAAVPGGSVYAYIAGAMEEASINLIATGYLWTSSPEFESQPLHWLFRCFSIYQSWNAGYGLLYPLHPRLRVTTRGVLVFEVSRGSLMV